MKKIALNGIKGAGKFTIVDDEDYDFLSQFGWRLSRKGYATAYIPAKMQSKYPHKEVQMQRMLLWDEAKPGQLVDHINRDKLDNRRKNLRLCNISESNSNRGKINFKRRQSIISKYKGVWWDRNKWRTAITVNDKKIYLGRFDMERDAAIAYNTAARIFFGEHACLNDID